MKKQDLAYVAVVGVVFLAFVVVFNFFPRETFSEQERRDLADFPTFSWDALFSGDFADSISHWYSDTEPYRATFLTMSGAMRKALALQVGSDEEAITFVAADASSMPQGDEPLDAAAEENRQIEDFGAGGDNNANSKIAHSGILVIGKEPTARAMMAFGGIPRYTSVYAHAANRYKEVFPDVNIWVMPIPTSIEFYCPEKAKGSTKSEVPCFNALFDALDKKVHAVDIYSTLGRHASEDIYLRTDHHWAPLGGFYAAEQFAKQAGVPFKSLAEGYERRVVHGYVGSMYGYSGDIAVKNSPEDFVWYYPTKTTFKTVYHRYDLDKSYNKIAEHPDAEGQYFAIFKDGSGGAYCTFMGNDARITRVSTQVKNGRRVLIMKDSFGNTVPSCLFYSFEEVHVIDYRYFTKNMRKYVRDHKITDILFANNIVFCCTPSTGKIYEGFLDQAEGTGLGVIKGKGKTDGKAKADAQPAAKQTEQVEEKTEPAAPTEPAASEQTPASVPTASE